MSEIKVYVCSTADKAAEAEEDLRIDQFQKITVDQVDMFNYDAVTYEGGAHHEGPLLGKFVVIGRK
jgi:hypothetical protein